MTFYVEFETAPSITVDDTSKTRTFNIVVSDDTDEGPQRRLVLLKEGARILAGSRDQSEEALATICTQLQPFSIENVGRQLPSYHPVKEADIHEGDWRPGQRRKTFLSSDVKSQQAKIDGKSVTIFSLLSKEDGTEKGGE